MAQSARVTSIEAIREFRGSLCRFGDDVRSALGAVEMEIRRTLDWLLHDRPMYWQAQIKRRKEDVSLAKAEVFKRQIRGGPGREVHDSEQKEILRRAKRQLAEAEAKLEVVRKWAPVFQQAVFEYQSRSRPTSDMLEGDLQKALALLDRMTQALDAYIATAPPSAPAREAVASQSDPNRSAAAALASTEPTGSVPEPPDVGVSSELEPSGSGTPDDLGPD